MSLEVTVICDDCGVVMAGGKTGVLARKDARTSQFKAKTRLPDGTDYCGDCWHERGNRNGGPS